MQGRIKCNKCNNMIAIGTVFCPFCGSEQTPTGTTNDVSTRRKRGNHNVPIIKTGEDVMVPVKVKEVTVPKDEKGNLDKEVEEPTIKQENEQKATSNESSGIQKKDVENKDQKVYETDTPVSEHTDQENSGSIESEMTEQVPQNPTSTSEINEEEASEIFSGILEEESDKDSDSGEISADSPEENGKKKTKTSKIKQKKNQKAMEYELYHDTLTCCLNRNAYEKKLDELDSGDYCIIVADANNLKRTNDSLGHANGDILLVAIAQSLQAVFGNENCYRTGGDEFAVILEGIEEDVVKERIERFRIELKSKECKQRENGAQIDMKAAIGYAYGKKKDSVRNVCKKADENMYVDKHQLKQIYDPNYDGYYNDVKAQYEEMKVDFDRENMHKAIMVVLAVVVFMIFYIAFIF